MGYFGNPYQMGYTPYSGYAPASPQNGAGAMQGFAGQITRVNGRNGADRGHEVPLRLSAQEADRESCRGQTLAGHVPGVGLLGIC